MVKAILGRKIRMTRMYTDKGQLVAMTAIEAGPCPIVQIKSEDSDRYNAIQIGFQSVKEKALTKPQLGHFEKAGVEPQRFLKEIRLDSVDGYELGQKLDVSQFEEGESVDISATSIGRGFQGGVKKHHWGGGRKTHGSMFHRRIGSVSPGTGQGRIFKGKAMPGHMGNEKVTIQNLEVIKVDADNNLIYVKGGIPGPNGALVFLKTTTKTKRAKQK